MKVTSSSTLQMSSKLSPCPPLPVLHTPARKVKADSKTKKEWRVNPLARMKVQQCPMARVAPMKNSFNKVIPQQPSLDNLISQQYEGASHTSSMPEGPPSHKYRKITSTQEDIALGQNVKQPNVDHPQNFQFLKPSNKPNIQRTTQRTHKLNGIRKTQCLSMNNKFSNLTKALNTAYKKSQEQAEKRLKMEKSLLEKSAQVMSF